MSAIVGPVRMIPGRVTHLQHRWFDWRLRRVGESHSRLSSQLEAIRLERIEIEGHCSLENPQKGEQVAKLKERKSEVKRKLESVEARLDTLRRSHVRRLVVTAHNK